MIEPLHCTQFQREDYRICLYKKYTIGVFCCELKFRKNIVEELTIKGECMVIGNFNIDLKTNSFYAKKLQTTMLSLGIKQYVNEPTRYEIRKKIIYLFFFNMAGATTVSPDVIEDKGTVENFEIVSLEQLEKIVMGLPNKKGTEEGINSDIKNEWIALKDIAFYCRGIALLPERWEKVVENGGNYFD
ncbi:hypothetical protein ALC57_12993 [Trachymyrmex cornetzi]|uniref:Uncharacterized protein n=1 Tax=Trachymyrmex cornetzi TaxID=471704 RepID=A0A151J083_9HYME|nr:hypothetical protein ALC57_12993 [Trachymyrmex cornetzi]